MLFSHLNILAIPSRIRHTSEMELIVKCCVILHNMIVEERYSDNGQGFGTKNIVRIDPDE